jgi:tryptophan-rich hypothetical protein
MNKFSAEKLHLSKWTAVHPVNREKHFIVTRLLRDDNEVVQACQIEAVHSRREQTLDWRELKNSERWLQGWL